MQQHQAHGARHNSVILVARVANDAEESCKAGLRFQTEFNPALAKRAF
jgi:hypothetical protein